jgi:hypothetical protein
MLGPKAKPVRSESYRRFVASFPCFGCGIEGYSQCAHANYGRGLGQKACDLQTFPLCAARPGHQGCHILHDQLIDIDRTTRRELEVGYVERMQAIARQHGRHEFKEAA